MKIISLIISILYVAGLNAQDYPYYRYYTFEEFSIENFGNPEGFKTHYLIHARYPAVARENQLETIVEILLINHSDTSFEILFLDKPWKVFTEEITSAITNTRQSWKQKSTPFLLRFCLEFKLVYQKEDNLKTPSTCSIQVTGYALSDRIDPNHTFNFHQVRYIPQVISYSTPFQKKNQPMFAPNNSIEKVLELFIKSVSSKNIQLRHLPPNTYKSMYKPQPRGKLQISLNESGHVTELKLIGTLADKINQRQLSELTEQLTNIYFAPALNHFLKPVKIQLEYVVVE